MATVVNTGTTDRGTGVSGIVALLLLALVLFVLFYYGVPALRGGFGGGTNVTIPDQVDVNVNPAGGGAPAAPAQ